MIWGVPILGNIHLWNHNMCFMRGMHHMLGNVPQRWYMPRKMPWQHVVLVSYVPKKTMEDTSQAISHIPQVLTQHQMGLSDQILDTPLKLFE